MQQLVMPVPMIPCVGGWCLQYVREAFRLPIKYGSATEAWNMSKSQHKDRNFPAGVWLPVWYGIDEEPLGHVILRSPEGRVYSTSDYSGWPVIHESLEALEAFYAYYGMTLRYRGWTEDVASYAVVGNSTINAESTTVKKAGGFLDTLTPDEQRLIFNRMKYLDAPVSSIPNKVMEQPVVHGGTHSFKAELVLTRQAVNALTALVAQSAKNPDITIEEIQKVVDESLAKAVIDVDVNVNGNTIPKPAG
jgi:hypothetical protein